MSARIETRIRLLRRKIALTVCPELGLTISDFPISCPDNEDGQRRAAQIRLLDEIMTSWLGRRMVWRDVKPARGVPADCGNLDEYGAYLAVQTARKLRPETPKTCGDKAYMQVMFLFSAIWPAGLEWPVEVPRYTLGELEWPTDIPRPPKSTSEEVA